MTACQQRLKQEDLVKPGIQTDGYGASGCLSLAELLPLPDAQSLSRLGGV